jgi:hypothetical protein
MRLMLGTTGLLAQKISWLVGIGFEEPEENVVPCLSRVGRRSIIGAHLTRALPTQRKQHRAGSIGYDLCSENSPYEPDSSISLYYSN